MSLDVKSVVKVWRAGRWGAGWNYRAAHSSYFEPSTKVELGCSVSSELLTNVPPCRQGQIYSFKCWFVFFLFCSVFSPLAAVKKNKASRKCFPCVPIILCASATEMRDRWWWIEGAIVKLRYVKAFHFAKVNSTAGEMGQKSSDGCRRCAVSVGSSPLRGRGQLKMVNQPRWWNTQDIQDADQVSK